METGAQGASATKISRVSGGDLLEGEFRNIRAIPRMLYSDATHIRWVQPSKRDARPPQR